MGTYKLYLSHPSDSHEAFRRWELEFERSSGIEIHNPFYDADRNDLQQIGNTLEKHSTLDYKKLVMRDIDGIKKSDGLIAIINGQISYGTIQEMVYARLFGKPVYSLITNNMHRHPWLLFHSSYVFIMMSDMERYLRWKTSKTIQIKID